MENLYNYKTTTLAASFKDADSKKGIITGYFSAFGNKDSDGDVIVKGAFTKTIEDRGPESTQPRIKHLLNHKIDLPIGKLLVLKEDDKGLYYESQVGTHSIGKEFVKMVESGLISEHSIGYRVIKWEKDQNDEHVIKLTELQLWEGSSLTAWGANSETPLTGIKSHQDYKNEIQSLLKTHKTLESFCYNSTATDEAIEYLILYNKQLTQRIINLTKEYATQPVTSTEPDTFKDELIDGLQSIYSLLKIPTNGLTRCKGRSEGIIATG